MKTIPFALAATLLCATAVAGVRIETIDRDIATKKVDGAPAVVLVQDGNVRVNSGRSGAMLLKGSTIYVIDDKRKSYRELDKATMQGYANQANAAMAQMQDRMAKMSPKQREMMEKMMGGNMAGLGAPPKKKVYSARDTGKNDTVEGRKCRIWQMLRDGEVYEEGCVVPFSSLPGKEDFQKTFKNLAEAFEGLAAAAPNAGSETARSAVNGYPVRVRPIENGVPRGTETVLKSWTEESIPAAMFEVPAGYKKQAMPGPGMGMGGG
jgi:hypothetical protein